MRPLPCHSNEHGEAAETLFDPSLLKPKGGRYGAASNFATAALLPKVEPAGKGVKRSRGPVAGTSSTLEQMAARIMRKKR